MHEIFRIRTYIYIWIYERRTKVNRSVGASTEKCKRAGGFAQKTVFFMYRVSLKWFALGVLHYSLMVRNSRSNGSIYIAFALLDLFQICPYQCVCWSLNFFVWQQYLIIDLKLNELGSESWSTWSWNLKLPPQKSYFSFRIKYTSYKIIFSTKWSWNFFDRNFFVKRIFRANLFVFV